MTRSQMRTELLGALQDNSGSRFSTTQSNVWLDQAQNEIASELRLVRVPTTVTLTGSDTFASSQPNYTLDANTVFINEVYIQDTNNNEQRITVYDQDDLNVLEGPGWRATTGVGTPVYAYRAARNVLGIHPRPNNAYNGKTLRVIISRDPSAFSADTDTGILMAAMHMGIVYRAASYGYMWYGDTALNSHCAKLSQAYVSKYRNTMEGFSDDMRRFRW